MIDTLRLSNTRRVLVFAAAAFFSLIVLVSNTAPASAATNCWCINDATNECENHDRSSIAVVPGTTEFSCTACTDFCSGLNRSGTSDRWHAMNCDDSYINRCTTPGSLCDPVAGSCAAPPPAAPPPPSPTACVCDAGPNRNFSDCGSCEAYCVGGGHTLMSYGGRRLAHCSEIAGTPASGAASRTCRPRPATGCATGEVLDTQGTGGTDDDQCCRDSAAPAPAPGSPGGTVTPTTAAYRCDACACDCDRNPATPARTINWEVGREETDTDAACLQLCSSADMCGPPFVAETNRDAVSAQGCREVQREITEPAGAPTTFTAANPGAAAGRAGATATLTDPLGGVSVPQLLGRVINAFLGLSGSLGLLVFIYGGFLWLTSGGSPEKITQGRNAIVWATLGLLLIFGAYAIVNFVLRTILGAAAG